MAWVYAAEAVITAAGLAAAWRRGRRSLRALAAVACFCLGFGAAAPLRAIHPALGLAVGSLASGLALRWARERPERGLLATALTLAAGAAALAALGLP